MHTQLNNIKQTLSSKELLSNEIKLPILN